MDTERQILEIRRRESATLNSTHSERTLNAENEIRNPTLVSHAKFRWDEIRKEHQIVYPEGVLVLNESGASIIELCDGRSTDQLIGDLEAKVNLDLSTDVRLFLERLAEKGLICNAAETS